MKTKQLIALLLVAALCIQLFPLSVFAEEPLPAPGVEMGSELQEETPVEDETGAEAGTPGTVVLGEMTDRRGQSEKHFRMDDGSFIAVDYGIPVHYSTDEGETWEDIDNTLVLSGGQGDGAEQLRALGGEVSQAAYTAENGDTSHSFAADLHTGFLFSARNGDHGVSMSLTPPAGDPIAAGTPTEPKSGTSPKAAAQARPDAVGSGKAEAEEGTASYPDFNPFAVAEISYPNLPDTPGDAAASSAPEAASMTGARNADAASGPLPSSGRNTPEGDAASPTSGEMEAPSSDPEPAVTEAPSIADQVTPARLQADVLYRDVFDGVDLSYSLYSFNVKETILVNHPLNSYTFPFYLDPEGLTPVLMADGSVELRDTEGEAVYLIPAPYMTDAEGAYSDAVAYTLTQSPTGAWCLTVTADETWINDEARAFPVAIDPTVIDKKSTSEFIGRCIASGGNPHNHINGTNGVCGYHSTYGQTEWYFKLEDMPSSIPNESEIVQVSLSIRQNDFEASQFGPITLSLHPCLSAISNYNVYISWENKPALGEVLDYVVASSSTIQTWHFWDITREAKKWFNPSQDNYGLAMTSDATSSNQRRAWFSYSNMYLIASYRDMSGIEPYYSYQALGADRAGAAYISDYTGALTTVTPLVSYASTVNPFSLNLVYNSSYFQGNAPDNATIPERLGYGMHMGSGFNLSLLQKVEYVDLQYEIESTNTKRYIKYTDGDGTAHYFATDSEKQANEPAGSTTYYYDEDGLGLKITEYVPNYFRMEDDKGNEMTFVYGYLTIIKDTNSNRIRIWFSDSSGQVSETGYPLGANYKPHHITQINNGQSAITVTAFTYNSDDGNNTLHTVTDAAGNVYSFSYTNHKLLSIQRNNTDYVSFTHDYSSETNRFINPVKAVNDCISGYSLKFNYEDSRVSQYREAVGTATGAGATITRVPGEKTIYTDWGNDRLENNSDDISTTYLFDFAGRTVNAFSTDVNGKILGASNAVHSGTGDTDKQNNRTLRSASIGMGGVSMIRNGGFELSGSNLAWTPVIPTGSTCNAVVKTGELTHTGDNAFKTWVNSTATGPTGAKKLIGILTAGETYTASVYVNTSVASNFGDKGIYLRVMDSYGSYRSGEYLNYKTNTAIDGGWVKLSFHFTPTRSVNHYVCIYDEGVKGAVYYDDLQVEQGDAPTNVNLLDNGGISGTAAGWRTEGDTGPTLAGLTAIQGNYALQITGSPSAEKYIHQTVSLNQPGTQTYVLSGWAKADAVPDNQNPEKNENETEEDYRQRVAQDANKQFGLRAVLNYSDNTKEYHYVPFNADVTEWQFASLAIVPNQKTKTVSTIQVLCAYERNANSAWFDNISLVKEVAQTMRYNEEGYLESVSSTDQAEQSAEYQNGNLIQANTGTATLSYTYDDSHNMTSASDGTVKETYEHDTLGNVTASKLSPDDDASTYIKSSRTYTTTGNLVKTITDARGKETTNTYGTYGSQMMGLPTKVHSPNNTEVTTTYHDDGRVNTSGISGTVSLSRDYDEKLRLTQLDREGYNGSGGTAIHQLYKFDYDAFGNTKSIKVGTKTLASYTYSPRNGALTRMTYGNDDYVDYSYDNLGRKTEMSTSDGHSYEYRYTGDGQLYEITDPDGGLLYRYTYDSIGRLIGSSMKSGSAVKLETWNQYDENNHVTGQNWTMSGKTYGEAFEYDENNGRLERKTVTYPTPAGNSASHQISLTYDALSRVSRIDGKKTQTRFGYLAGADGSKTGMVSLYSVRKQSDNSAFYTYTGYTYDDVGNITRIEQKSANGATISYVDYTYDNQSQLLSETGSDGTTKSYTYDTFGNLRTAKHYVNQVLTASHTYSYGNSAWPDLLTAYDGQNIAYEGHTYNPSTGAVGGACTSGNPISYYNGTRWTFDWENGRKLVSASGGGHEITYDYDVNGLRTYKIVDGVRHDYIYASGLLLRESFTLDGNSYDYDFVYDQNGRPYMLNYISNGYPSQYYYVLNLQGDVIALVNSEGTEVAKYTYDAWGNVTPDTTLWLSNRNPLRYRGYYYDTESGFYYLQSRYYDPALGRFINADSYASTGQGFLGFNMFAYCENNPIINADIIGNACIAIIYDNTGGDNEFLANYAKKKKKQYEKNGDTVEMMPVVSVEDFKSAWESLGVGQYDSVDILLHGSPGAISCGTRSDGASICIGHDSRYYCKYDFDVLADVQINDGITLYSCNGGTYAEGGSAGRCLSNKAKTNVTAISGSRGYFMFNGAICIGPFPLWGRWLTFTYQAPRRTEKGGNRSMVV